MLANGQQCLYHFVVMSHTFRTADWNRPIEETVWLNALMTSIPLTYFHNGCVHNGVGHHVFLHHFATAKQSYLTPIGQVSKIAETKAANMCASQSPTNTEWQRSEQVITVISGIAWASSRFSLSASSITSCLNSPEDFALNRSHRYLGHFLL